MRGGLVVTLTILAIVILGEAVVSMDGNDASARPENEPTEPAILCYYWGDEYDMNKVETYYVVPNKPIGANNIVELSWPGYWIRMDTGDVVDASSVFEPGTYMIKVYGSPPEPWGHSEDPVSSSNDNGMADWAIIMTSVISSVAIVIIIKSLLAHIKK